VLSPGKQGKHGAVARPDPKALLPAALTWVALLGLWMVLSGSLVLSELVVGIVAATIGAVAFDIVRRQGLLTFRPRGRWLLRASRLPWQVLRDTWLVSAGLIRSLVLRKPIRGRFREITVPRDQDESREPARRALFIAGVSLAPNMYVVDTDPDSDKLLVHELMPRRDGDLLP
jgi:multisubunit Na+/H+ antiporter MnhE subunit